jgi:hypothetical protein
VRRAAALATMIACAALAAGCGDDGATGGDQPDTNLRLALDVDGPGGKAPQTAQIICEQEMDTSPCPEVAELDAADLAPVPTGMACTEIYGGPETATISGILHGEAVNATLRRSNGCEIERFNRTAPLLEAVFADYKVGASLKP